MTSADRRRGRRRRREVYVFAEGEVTEPEYVDQLKRRQDVFSVKVSNEHGGPDKLIPLAIKHKRHTEDEFAREGLPPDEYPVVWCVFDRDQHENIDELTERAEQAGVRVAFSHPCFEFWVLLHYEDCAAPMTGRCTEAEKRLKRHCPKLAKRFTLSMLDGTYERAKSRAKRIGERHDKDGRHKPSSRDPSSTVWRFVDFLGVDY